MEKRDIKVKMKQFQMEKEYKSEINERKIEREIESQNRKVE